MPYDGFNMIRAKNGNIAWIGYSGNITTFNENGDIKSSIEIESDGYIHYSPENNRIFTVNGDGISIVKHRNL